MSVIQGEFFDISTDEPAYNLKEVIEPASDYKAMRRYQYIRVVRGQELVEWRRDMGLASDFTASQLRVMGGWIDTQTGRGVCYETVGTLMEEADKMRRDQAQETPYEMKPSINFAQAYADQVDRERREAVGRKVFQK